MDPLNECGNKKRTDKTRTKLNKATLRTLRTPFTQIRQSIKTAIVKTRSIRRYNSFEAIVLKLIFKPGLHISHKISSTWLQTRFLSFPRMPWSSHSCNDHRYSYFTRNICNRCVDSLKDDRTFGLLHQDFSQKCKKL